MTDTLLTSAVARPSARARLIVSLVIGLASGLLVGAFQAVPGVATDFIYPWTAARALLGGANPYAALPGGMAHPFEAPLLYPLPAVLVAAPLVSLALPLAVGVFVGISASILAYVLSERSWDRLALLLSAPFIVAVMLGQWSPLLTAMALLPAGGFLAIAKPNLGLALTIYRPTRVGIIGSVAVLAVSVLVLPTWPHDWLHGLGIDHHSGTHVAPLATPIGLLLILAALRWRRPEARLFLAMACVPQLLFFYDQLPLLLVADTRRERYALMVPSSAAFLLWMLLGHQSSAGPEIAEWCVMLSLYLPCLIMILRRPNEGKVFAWVDRLLLFVRAWLPRREETAR